MLKYKQADKAVILGFLENELASRAIVQRMKEYFSGQKANNPKLELMLNSDCEGIYNYVVDLISHQPMKQKIKRAILRIISA